MWADLAKPAGSGPGFRRTVLVIQGDALNRSRISTILCVPLSSNLKWAVARGNVLLSSRVTRPSKDSVANVSQIVAIDRSYLNQQVFKVSRKHLDLVLSGADVVLGR